MKITSTFRRSTLGAILSTLISFCLGAAMLGALAWTAHGANGLVYYNQITSLVTPATVRRVGGDGTGDQAVAVNLPSPYYPTISRNGRFLLLTSTEPGRPFKISNNVYIDDLLTGGFFRATSYSDEYVIGNVRFNNDIAQLFGDTTVSAYKVYFPYHKALSPNGAQMVVGNLFKEGHISAGAPLDGADVVASSGRLPFIDNYNVADALPAGAYIFLSAQVRDGFNQGGDGVDWHPALNEVVGTVANDIPAVGSAGITSMEGTQLAVFSTTAIPSLIRLLSHPVAEIDIISGNLFYFGVHDYAPAISPDGQRVAYVRHVMRLGIQSGYAPFPAQCSIHVINYNGTGDQTVLSFADGSWVTKVAWSPDGSQIAFDLSPQLVLNGWYSLLGDVTQSTIHVVNSNGTNPHQLIAGAAAYPSWGSAAATRPTLQISRNGNGLRIRVDGLTAGQPFRVEGSTDLRNWGTLLNTQATGSSQFIDITPNPQSLFAFYRVGTP